MNKICKLTSVECSFTPRDRGLQTDSVKQSKDFNGGRVIVSLL